MNVIPLIKLFDDDDVRMRLNIPLGEYYRGISYRSSLVQ